MIQERIVSTIRFFDLQGLPLTMLEVYKYLVVQPQLLKEKLDDSYELISENQPGHVVSFDTTLVALNDLVTSGRLEQSHGHFFLPGKKFLVVERLRNHVYGIARERRIKKWGRYLKYIPFVRGVGLVGSQALGQERSGSDIDLFLFTDSKFLWTARTLVTGYFQMLGVRRHGKKITNRFCLNHYVAGAKKIEHGKNLYTALEYVKLRSLTSSSLVSEFKNQNLWIYTFFPNAFRINSFAVLGSERSNFQKFSEYLFTNSLGEWFERILSQVQMKRIRQEKYIVVEPDELSFHPQSKEAELLQAYFK
ncbi:MAG: hypothetical protein IT410_01775 [Candidatus Doudnabacteria bacterium]|nr:hypothetical protein [Candidatus Doudnabacteria bacterium]